MPPPRVFCEALNGVWVGGQAPDKADKWTWPERTDVACWHCAQQFSNRPLPLVEDYDPWRKIYRVFGCDCSEACASGYLSERQQDRKLMLQRLFFIDCCGRPFDYFLPRCNPVQSLKYFGGTMSYEEWKSTKDVIVQVTEESMRPYKIGHMRYVETQHQQDQNQPESLATENGIYSNKKVAEILGQTDEPIETLPNVKRPPKERIIATPKDLAAAFPNVDIGENNAFFSNYLQSQKDNLPSAEVCEEMRKKLQQQASDKRQRKHPRKVSDVPVPVPLVQQQKEKRAQKIKQRNDDIKRAIDESSAAAAAAASAPPPLSPESARKKQASVLAQIPRPSILRRPTSAAVRKPTTAAAAAAAATTTSSGGRRRARFAPEVMSSTLAVKRRSPSVSPPRLHSRNNNNDALPPSPSYCPTSPSSYVPTSPSAWLPNVVTSKAPCPPSPDYGPPKDLL